MCWNEGLILQVIRRLCSTARPFVQMCIIYELEDQPSVFLVACQYDIAPEQSPLWAETLLNHIIPKRYAELSSRALDAFCAWQRDDAEPRTRRTVIFDSFTTYQFKSATEDTSPPLLRKLKSSTAEEVKSSCTCDVHMRTYPIESVDRSL